MSTSFYCTITVSSGITINQYVWQWGYSSSALFFSMKLVTSILYYFTFAGTYWKTFVYLQEEKYISGHWVYTWQHYTSPSSWLKVHIRHTYQDIHAFRGLKLGMRVVRGKVEFHVFLLLWQVIFFVELLESFNSSILTIYFA